jgi:hypothetical protein
MIVSDGFFGVKIKRHYRAPKNGPGWEWQREGEEKFIENQLSNRSNAERE